MDSVTLNQTASNIATAAQALNMSTSQFIKFSSDLSAVPALIIIFVLTHLLFLIVGISLVDKKKKLFTIWVITFVLSGIVLLVLIYLPNVTQQILSYLR